MKKKLLSFAVIVLFTACSKDELSTLTSVITLEKKQDRIILSGERSHSESNEDLKYNWICDNSTVLINGKNKSEAFFIYPDSDAPSHISISLEINNKLDKHMATEIIELPAFNDHITEWGLGDLAYDRVSNNVNYNWYYDQMNTGDHSMNNCGPSVVTMAAKWFDVNYSKTPEYARSKYYPNGGWWYTYNIMDFLEDVEVNRWIVPFIEKSVDENWLEKSADIITNQLKEGNILILCLDMHLIRSESNQNYRIDKFYGTSDGWGHFIVVKGFRLVDGILFLEVYDPYCWGVQNIDGTLKGKNRYYRANDVLNSTQSWWHNSIVVSRQTNSDPQYISKETAIEHAWGR
ncbi:MAG: hypothetical protein N4A71_16920 [Carboxylicivirga sp.]|nr:hypothetical protein [Carboxylicivirga sp.]